MTSQHQHTLQEYRLHIALTWVTLYGTFHIIIAHTGVTLLGSLHNYIALTGMTLYGGVRMLSSYFHVRLVGRGVSLKFENGPQLWKQKLEKLNVTSFHWIAEFHLESSVRCVCSRAMLSTQSVYRICQWGGTSLVTSMEHLSCMQVALGFESPAWTVCPVTCADDT